MAEILGLGLTHYPPLCLPDADMAGILRWTLQASIPEREKDAAHWPAAMRAEWSDDFGARAAAAHRKQLVAGFERVRAALDAFRPDVVVIWGDDQYENFKEDVIPPFAILAYDDLDLHPWAHAHGRGARIRPAFALAQALHAGRRRRRARAPGEPVARGAGRLVELVARLPVRSDLAPAAGYAGGSAAA